MSTSERYHRQLILKDFGEAAQQKLLNAKVLVVGAGGLSCPALQYLTAAGVGTIGIIDDDFVALSNLHRQILFSVEDIGKAKAERAVAILAQLNPEIDFHAYNTRLTANNAVDIITSYDIVLDGSDNFPTRYLVNDACVLLNKPLVYGAVSQYEGQVAVFNYKVTKDRVPTNYRDLFPEPPLQSEILNCEEAGVLGVVPGIIGTLMASETIKLITGIGEPLVDSLVTFDARNNQLYQIELIRKKGSRQQMPKDLQSVKNMNYEWLCYTPHALEITHEVFDELLEKQDVTVVDVRELDEMPRPDQFSHLSIPISQLQNSISSLNTDTIVLYCQTGKRSLQAARQLTELYGDKKKIFSLKGGIIEWLHKHGEMV
jgi:molybdopterin/thiamine biosynthesis adenylyltransferase/rhodanese-related sulfurtransferase